jgi:tetratricopeptide (TPR) repeat protein
LLVVVAGDLDYGAALVERALALNPNLGWAWHFGALTKAFLEEPETAIEHAARAIRLSPHDPQMFGMQAVTAFAHFITGRYDKAWSWAETAIREQPNFFLAACVAEASAALAGKVLEAEGATVRLRRLNPALRHSNLENLLPFRRQEDFERWS